VSARLLLVDDEPGILGALAAFLRIHGIEVRTCAGVRDALIEVAERRADLLVSDEQLPDGSGRQVVDAFLRSNDHVRALLSTANASSEVRAFVDSDGRVDLIPKPVRPGSLLAWVREAQSVAAPSPRPSPGSTGVGAAALPVLEALDLDQPCLRRCKQAWLPFERATHIVEARLEPGWVELRLAIDDPSGLPALRSSRSTGDAWIVDNEHGDPTRAIVRVFRAEPRPGPSVSPTTERVRSAEEIDLLWR